MRKNNIKGKRLKVDIKKKEVDWVTMKEDIILKKDFEA